MRLLLQRLRAAKHSDGFTLIELLIVIIILGILAGIVVFGVAQFKKNSQVAACKADVKTVETAAEAYNATNGDYPSSVKQLVDGGYLKSAPSEQMSINQTNGNVTSSSCP